MPFEAAQAAAQSQLKEGVVSPDNGFSEFGQSLEYAALQTPIEGGTQLMNNLLNINLRAPVLIDKPVAESWETSVGSLAGSALDVIILTLALKRSWRSGLLADLERQQKIAKAMKIGGSVGTIMSAVTPVDDSGNYWQNKSRDVVASAGSYAILGAVGGFLDNVPPQSLLVDASQRGFSSVGRFAANTAIRGLLYWQKPSDMRLPELIERGGVGALQGVLQEEASALAQ